MTTPQVARAWRVAALVAASLGLAQAAAAQAPSEEQRAAIRAACRSDYIAHCAGVPPGGAEALACLREHLASASAACQQAVNAIGTAAPAAPTPAPAAAAPPAPAPTPAPAAAGGRAAAALARMQPNDEQFGVILEACGPDIHNHCASVERGPGWQLQCLRENAASLSTGCEQVLVAIASTAPAAAAATPPAPAVAAPPAPAPTAVAPTAPPPPAAARARPSREQIIAVFQSCRRDMREYCAGGRGPGPSIRCLRDNAANLSPGCQEALAAVASGAPGEAGAGASAFAIERPARPVSPREVFFLIRTACGPDFRAYCAGGGFGAGRAIGCLRENAANLSPTCRNALSSIAGRR
jgi:hypothetical protein